MWLLANGNVSVLKNFRVQMGERANFRETGYWMLSQLLSVDV